MTDQTGTGESTVSFKCSNCGGPLVFSIDTQKWECNFCGASYTEEELIAHKHLEEDQASSEPVVRPPPADSPPLESPFFDQELNAYTCPDCGGQVLADKNTVSTFCAFCHNPTVMASKLTGVHKPDKIIPFKLNKDETQKSLERLMRFKPLLPKHFRNAVSKGEIAGLYVPFWLFDADINADLSASARIITAWSDSSYNYTKTDVYSVHRSGVVPLRLVPVDASGRMDDTLMDSIEPFDPSGIKDFRMEYFSGYLAESFDISSEQSFPRFDGRGRLAAQNVLRGTISGYTSVTTDRFVANINNAKSSYAMLPVWTISVKDKGKIYSYAMNGQTGKSAGKLPVSTARLVTLLLGAGVLLSAIIYVIGLFMGGVL